MNGRKLLTTLFLSLAMTGCSMLGGGNDTSQKANQSAHTDADSPPSPDQFDSVVFPGKNMKGRVFKKPYPDVMGDTRGFKGARKVTIPMYVVNFDKSAGESASASTGTFGTGPNANAHLNAKLKGVDENTFKRITEKAYLDFSRKLSAAGFQVVPLESLKASDAYQEWDTDDYPVVKKGYSKYMPDGMRTAGKITAGIKWGKLMNDVRAAIVQPELAVNFATFGTRERDNWSDNGTATASVSMGPAVTVGISTTGTSFDAGSCDKLGRCYGKGISVRSGQLVSSDIAFGRIVDTTGTGAKVAMGAVNMLAMLSGTSTTSHAEKTVFANPAYYEKAALQALYEANTRIVNKLKAADKVD